MKIDLAQLEDILNASLWPSSMSEMIENLGSNGVEKLEYLGNKGSPPDSLETRCQDDTEIKKMNLTKLLILQPQVLSFPTCSFLPKTVPEHLC